MRKYTIKINFPLVLISMLLLIGIYGCGSVTDSNYSPSNNPGFHPFGEGENDLSKHANYLRSDQHSLSECTVCHGADLKGVDNGAKGEDDEDDRSCYSCHNVNHHIVPFTGTSRDHSSYMREHNWDLNACYICHNNSATDQRVALGGSCNNSSCHNQSPAGPQACYTCHGYSGGDPTDPANWAPPSDLMGNRFNTERGVGNHQSHVRMTTGNFGVISCNVCHVMPQAWNSPGHISDSTPNRAEVVFSYPATKGTADPIYNDDNSSCSSTYCHWRKTAQWTQIGGWTECGSCHAIPPETPHLQSPTREDCHRCHGRVIDDTGTIIAPRLHANGTINMN